MERLRAFDDERLDADLAAILHWRDGGETPSIARRRTRRRDAIARALRSPAGSATIGVSVFLAMLGTTGFLMYHPRGGPVVEATPDPAALANTPAPALPAAAPALGDVAAAVVPATIPRRAVAERHDGRHGRPALRAPSRTRPSAPPITLAEAERTVGAPVVLNDVPRPDLRRATDLAQNAPASPRAPVETAAVVVDETPAINDDAATEGRSARVRRNSVAAIRALRRQW